MTASKRPSPGGRKPAGSGKPSPRKPAAKPPAKARAATPSPKPASPPAAPKPVVEKPPPRGQLMPKLAKALRAHYKPIQTNVSRPLLEQVLFACCLENAPADVAERALARLVESAFDLNEIRVTTVAELAEALHDLPDPSRAALSLRRVLQSVFESTYAFSLDHARKHSLAHGLKTLEGLHGIPPFVVHHVASTALGGHFIPLDRGALTALFLCGMITQQEYDTGKVPGLERLIGKKAGVEFSSQLHQFGVECLANLHGTTVRKIVMTVNPGAKDRFPKRGEQVPAPVPPPVGKEPQKSAEDHRPAGPQAAARPAGKTPLPPAGSGPKKPGDGKPGPKPFVVKPNVGKPLTIKPQPPAPPPPAAKKPSNPPKPAGRRPEPKKGPKHSASLQKRKPR